MAVHILAILAKSGGKKVKSDSIAGSVNTNPVVIRRLLCCLQEAALVVSQKGASGGTLLAKKPSEIRLSEIFEAVAHGEVFSLHRQKPNQDCPVGRNIEAILCNLQKEIDRTVAEKLISYTLADVSNYIDEGGGSFNA